MKKLVSLIMPLTPYSLSFSCFVHKCMTLVLMSQNFMTIGFKSQFLAPCHVVFLANHVTKMPSQLYLLAHQPMLPHYRAP